MALIQQMNNLDLLLVFDEFFWDASVEITELLLPQKKRRVFLKLRDKHTRHIIDHTVWLEAYNERTFYELFRMRRKTFRQLFEVVIAQDTNCLIKKKYRGGNYPTAPEKSLLVFIWYISKQDTLLSIADHFDLVPSSVMNIVNCFLYLLLRLKKKYIFWPQTDHEYRQIQDGFTKYPNVIGAVDGTHVVIKVPSTQHDSYIDRYQTHSINLMAICTSAKIFTYVFVGYPGSAHDSRVFSNSALVRHIETYGKRKYFPNDECHLIGDSAFPLRTWLMTPFSRRNNLNRRERYHNFGLSSDRVCIENTFGILKGRWRRLQYINTYAVSKAIEITTAACVLHNFCYLNQDEWPDEELHEQQVDEYMENDREAFLLGQQKRDNIAIQLFNNNNVN